MYQSIQTHRFRSGIVAAITALSFSPSLLADHVDGGVATQSVQARPSQLGVSGSSIEFVVSKNRLYCYTGTLGSLVQDSGGTKYILSNNHVLAKENNPDIVSTNPDSALYRDGFQIIQPGLLDEGSCSTSLGDPNNIVATLAEFEQIQFGKGRSLPENKIDAAIAEIASNCGVDGSGQVIPCVNSNGHILGIGGVSGTTTVSVDDWVQKTGRTTGHTYGTVKALHVTVRVGYDSGDALFTDQIEVTDHCDSFSAGGDSGSLILNLPTSGAAPAATGLLFAGGGSSTFANPIGAVLNGGWDKSPLSMVDCAASGASCDTTPEATTQPAACPTEEDSSGGPPPGRGKNRSVMGLEQARQVASDHSRALFSLPGVQGHGIGMSDGGAVIRVYVDTASARRAAEDAIPASIEGVPVVQVMTGPINAY